MKHFTNNGKEYLRQYDDEDIDYQGRSKEQYSRNLKAVFFSYVGIIVIIAILLLTSCSTSKQTTMRPPTFKQWCDLEPYEKNIIIDYVNDELEDKYKVIKKIKFNKNGRKEIKKIYFNRQGR